MSRRNSCASRRDSTTSVLAAAMAQVCLACLHCRPRCLFSRSLGGQYTAWRDTPEARQSSLRGSMRTASATHMSVEEGVEGLDD